MNPYPYGITSNQPIYQQPPMPGAYPPTGAYPPPVNNAVSYPAQAPQ